MIEILIISNIALGVLIVVLFRKSKTQRSQIDFLLDFSSSIIDSQDDELEDLLNEYESEFEGYSNSNLSNEMVQQENIDNGYNMLKWKVMIFLN